MTAPTPPVEYTPPDDSRLSALCAELTSIEDEAKQLNDRVEELKDAIKAELSGHLPDGGRSIVLNSKYLDAPRQMVARDSWRFDSKRCKKERPDIYAAFATRSTSWRLEKVSTT